MGRRWCWGTLASFFIFLLVWSPIDDRCNLQCAYPSVDHLFSLTDVSLLAQSISYLLNQRFNSRSRSSSPSITGLPLRMKIAVKAWHSYLHHQILPRRSSSPTSISGNCLVASLLLILRQAQSWWITSPSLPLEGGYSAPQFFSKKVFRVCTLLSDAKNSSSVNVTITHWSVMKITPSCTPNGQEYCTLKSVWYHRLSLGWEILQVPIRTICYRTAGAFIGRNDHRYFWSRTPTET